MSFVEVIVESTTCMCKADYKVTAELVRHNIQLSPGITSGDVFVHMGPMGGHMVSKQGIQLGIPQLVTVCPLLLCLGLCCS